MVERKKEEEKSESNGRNLYRTLQRLPTLVKSKSNNGRSNGNGNGNGTGRIKETAGRRLIRISRARAEQASRKQ